MTFIEAVKLLDEDESVIGIRHSDWEHGFHLYLTNGNLLYPSDFDSSCSMDTGISSTAVLVEINELLSNDWQVILETGSFDLIRKK